MEKRLDGLYTDLVAVSSPALKEEECFLYVILHNVDIVSTIKTL